jgi:ribosome-associated toxin RatA of RatAB toxin-antitoxin module
MRFALPRPRTLAAAALLALTASLTSASPEAAPASRNVERFDVKVPNSSLDAGGARARAHAPTATVRSVVTDYSHYSAIITHFEQARVVGRSGAHTDVYLEVPILRGVGKIWAVVRFSPPEAQGDHEVIRGRMLKGNVKRLDATWRIKKVDAQASELSLDLLIVPDVPAPKSLITSELRKAAGKAVNSARNEAERRTRR